MCKTIIYQGNSFVLVKHSLREERLENDGHSLNYVSNNGAYVLRIVLYLWTEAWELEYKKFPNFPVQIGKQQFKKSEPSAAYRVFWIFHWRRL